MVYERMGRVLCSKILGWCDISSLVGLLSVSYFSQYGDIGKFLALKSGERYLSTEEFAGHPQSNFDHGYLVKLSVGYILDDAGFLGKIPETTIRWLFGALEVSIERPIYLTATADLEYTLSLKVARHIRDLTISDELCHIFVNGVKYLNGVDRLHALLLSSGKRHLETADKDAWGVLSESFGIGCMVCPVSHFENITLSYEKLCRTTYDLMKRLSVDGLIPLLRELGPVPEMWRSGIVRMMWTDFRYSFSPQSLRIGRRLVMASESEETDASLHQSSQSPRVPYRRFSPSYFEEVVMGMCGITSARTLFDYLWIDVLGKIAENAPQLWRWAWRLSTISQKMWFYGHSSDINVWDGHTVYNLKDLKKYFGKNVRYFNVLASKNVGLCFDRRVFYKDIQSTFDCHLVSILSRFEISVEKLFSDGVIEKCVRENNKIVLGSLVLRYLHSKKLRDVYEKFYERRR